MCCNLAILPTLAISFSTLLSAWPVLLSTEGSHVLPVMERDKLAILSKLHDCHMTTRSDAFHDLQVNLEWKVCHSCMFFIL